MELENMTKLGTDLETILGEHEYNWNSCGRIVCIVFGYIPSRVDVEWAIGPGKSSVQEHGPSGHVATAAFAASVGSRSHRDGFNPARPQDEFKSLMLYETAYLFVEHRDFRSVATVRSSTHMLFWS
ncbi:hypothetical protein DOTSEDRAFT_39583 [Dothistroma septosporum NZE10]|uniref:Uncharacterized protein n=1 Tax=Dothistroma septosporum (strain NZE10 / CBS 128990) TaxID=675120 RepID=M2YHQ6_DOTSN|nr:hypothetical protein DOTSEDRAFT_39583 [Dothistroma septosporum NZE10]